MNTASLWQRLFKKTTHAPAQRKKAGRSTRLMAVELLEDRLVPATIFVHNLSDGTFVPLTPLGGSNFLAANLRSAVEAANGIAGANTILLDTATYRLNNTRNFGGELEINYDTPTALTIKNNAGGVSTIDATPGPESPSSRIFEVDAGGVTTLDHLKLTNGNVPTSQFNPTEGGAILNHGNLTLTNDQIVNNHATGYGGNGFPQRGSGGGVFNGANATLTVKNSLFDSNTATGGSPQFNGSGAGAEGGGICLGSGSGAVSITASTFSNNQAIGGNAGAEGVGGTAMGGAIELAQTGIHLNVVNSTFSGNSASGGSGLAVGLGGNAYGGAIVTMNQNQVNLVNDTIANNHANGGIGTFRRGTGYGGAIANFGGINLIDTPVSFVNVVNTIIAKNQADGSNNDLFGTYRSLGHNLIGAATGSGFTAPGDQTGTVITPLDPGLDPAGLKNNGGPTMTIALIAGSKAIDAGDDLYGGFVPAPTTDQRGPGYVRKYGKHVDIGAFEVQPPPPPPKKGKGRDLLANLGHH